MDEPNILVKTALNEAVQQVNLGRTPTEALTKVANDFDLNPNYTQRVGEALNVALHYKHFKTASDRSTEFDIADIPKAINESLNLTEKTASEYVSDMFPSNHANTEVFNYNRILSNPLYKRAFLEIAGAKETAESFPTTLTTIYQKSANYVDNLQKTAQQAEVDHAEAEFNLNDKFSSLMQHFRKDAAYRTSFEEFESQAFSKYGKVAVPYLDLLHKAANLKEERGVHDPGYMMFDPCKESVIFDDLMKSATEMVATEILLKEARENLAFEEAYLKECKVLLGKTAAKNKEEKNEVSEKNPMHEALESKKHELEEKEELPESHPMHEAVESKKHEQAEKEEEPEEEEGEDPVLARVKKKVKSKESTDNVDPVKEAVIEKEAFLSSLLIAGKALTGLHGTSEKAFGGMMEQTLFTENKPPIKKPNMTLENMERKLLFQELVMTDPILSKVPASKVARAFEQLLRLSPQISKEKEVVRAELRAMVSTQALSKFDAELMTKLDSGMLKRRAATQEFNKGNVSIFRI
jgi:hypothetical protein